MQDTFILCIVVASKYTSNVRILRSRRVREETKKNLYFFQRDTREKEKGSERLWYGDTSFRHASLRFVVRKLVWQSRRGKYIMALRQRSNVARRS